MADAAEAQPELEQVPHLREEVAMTETLDVMCKPCPNCQRTSILTVPADGYRRWKEGGVLIQQALPDLTPDQRELLQSGTHAHCWEAMWGEDDE